MECLCAHLQFRGEDVNHPGAALCIALAVARDEDADEAGVVVERVEGCAVVHPLVRVQHAPVQPAVHALAYAPDTE